MFDIKANYNDAVASRKNRTHNYVDSLNIKVGLLTYVLKKVHLIYLYKK